MEGRLLLKNCSVFRSDGRIKDRMAVLVEGGRITRVVDDSELPVLPGDWEVACNGRLVIPGLIDTHTHLVGGQLVPFSGALMLRSTAQRFELQQRVESQLTASDVEILTTFALACAARDGVTMAVEHVHCPSNVRGALEAQRKAAETIGVRLVNSHATHSFSGESAAAAAVEANAELVKQHRDHPTVRTALGLHASWSCEDDLLRRAGRLREELGSGVHFHLAESEDDLMSSFARFNKRIVPRFEAFGLLGHGSVASYARAIDRGESDRLSRTRTLVSLSPRLSYISEPGGGGFESVLAAQNLIGLGSSGVSSLWEEFFAAFGAVMHVARVGRLLDPDDAVAQFLVSGPAELCSMIFGAPSGTVDAGGLADLVVYDLIPAKENPGGLASHQLMQLAQVPVAWTIVNGRVVVREGQLIGPNFLELSAEAAKVLTSVWQRAGVDGAVSGT
ncbi:MAG: amidohydrolase family protein [Myxococcaceae bacterium]